MNNKGLTLIEILIVIGILAILFSIIIIAINPARQFAQSRNTQRRSDVEAVLNAIQQRMVDNNGSFGEGSTCDPLPVAQNIITSDNAVGNVDLCACLVPTYLAELPYDPSDPLAEYINCENYYMDYTIQVDDDGRITIKAPSAELGEEIQVIR